MAKSEFKQKIDNFYIKFFTDAQFARTVRANPAGALALCDIDDSQVAPKVALWLDDDTTHHFVIPMDAVSGGSLGEEELHAIHAAKKSAGSCLYCASSVGSFLSCAGSAGTASTNDPAKLDHNRDLVVQFAFFGAK